MGAMSYIDPQFSLGIHLSMQRTRDLISNMKIFIYLHMYLKSIYAVPFP